MTKGSCLCGGLQFEVTGPIQNVGNCHCSICRKLHGAPFSTYAQVSKQSLEIRKGAELVRRYASSESVERTFCDTCGANFTFHFSALPDAVWVAVGLLEDDPKLRPEHHMFVASKASWHEITDRLPQYEEYPPLPSES